MLISRIRIFDIINTKTSHRIRSWTKWTQLPSSQSASLRTILMMSSLHKWLFVNIFPTEVMYALLYFIGQNFNAFRSTTWPPNIKKFVAVHYPPCPAPHFPTSRVLSDISAASKPSTKPQTHWVSAALSSGLKRSETRPPTFYCPG